MIEGKAERAKKLERERLELVAEADTLRREVSDLERRLATAKADKASAEDARERIRLECAATEQERNLGVRNLQRDFDALAMQSQVIAAYVQAGKDESRHRSLATLAATQRELEEKDSIVLNLEAELGGITDKLRNNDSLRRDLDDNVAFQQGLAMVQSLSNEIDELAAQGRDIGSYDALKALVDNADAEVSRKRNEQHMLRGRIETHKEMVSIFFYVCARAHCSLARRSGCEMQGRPKRRCVQGRCGPLSPGQHRAAHDGNGE